MSTSHNTIITLENLRFASVETLLALDMPTLRSLENQADKAVYDAGTQLEWIRGIIAKKIYDAGLPSTTNA